MEPVVIGKVVGPFGLEGDLEIEPLAPEEFLLSLKKVYLKRKGGGFETHEVERTLRKGRKFLMKIKGFDDHETCALLSGARLFADRGDLPPLEGDSYYAFELEGMEVVTEGGRELGKVVSVLDYPSYFLLSTDRGLIIPFVGEIVIDVNRERSLITVRDDRIP